MICVTCWHISPGLDLYYCAGPEIPLTKADGELRSYVNNLDQDPSGVRELSVVCSGSFLLLEHAYVGRIG